MKKIMVTGGAGLIGLEVSRQLTAMGYTVHLFDLGEQIERVRDVIPKEARVFYGSIMDRSSLRDAMKGCEVVIHLAALLGVERSEKDKLRCIEININGTQHVLDCAVQLGLGKIVFASSSEVYGEPYENPITEKTPTQGKTVYAITKLAGEELCKAYGQKFGIAWSILRYFNCYGPYQTAQFVISKFIRNVLKNEPPVVNGTGEQLRSYTFVTDTAEATVKAALLDQANGETLNIGNGTSPVSLNQLADLIIELHGGEMPLRPISVPDFFNCDRDKDREIFTRFCDASKAERVLEWKPQVSLETGIRKVFEVGVIFDRWGNLYDEDI